MSKKIDNHLLDRIGNPKKLIEKSLENQIRQVEAGLDEDASGLISKILMLFIPKEGKYLQLQESEIEEKLLVDQNLSKTKVQGILQRLNEVGILVINNGQYEMASAVLANHIYEKIEAENRVLRKVETFIHERFATYQENKNLLNQDDLNYIAPYLSTISISRDESNFIEKSKAKIAQRRRIITFVVLIIVSVLAALTIFSIAQSWEANRQKAIAEQESIKNKTLAEENEKLAQTAQGEASKNAKLAEENAKLADAAQAESNKNAALAAKNKKLANAAQAESDKNAALAESNEKLAKAAQKDADLKAELAQKNKELADVAQAESEKNKALADQNKELSNIILSRNIAKQATQLDEKETVLKALLAKEAFQINADSEEYGDINHPDIYHALYDGLKSLNKLENKEDFNQISNERGAIKSIIFDQSGDVFYTIGSYGALKKWEAKKWNTIEKPEVTQTTIDRFPEAQNVMKISPDNRWLVVGGKTQDIRLYDLNNLKEPQLLNLHDGFEVFDIVFVPDNTGFVSCGADKTLQFYNIKDNSVKKIANTQTRVEAITITPQKPYLLYYGTVAGKLFEQPVDGLPLQLEPNLHNEPLQRITAIEITQYGKKKILAIGYVNGLVKIFQADFGNFPVNRGGSIMGHSSKLHSARIADLTFNKTTQLLGVASYDGTASLWDLTASDLRQYQPILFNNGDSWVMSVAFSSENDQILLGSRDGEILFFNPDPSIYADEICTRLDRSLKREEWTQYIGTDLKFRKTCP